MWKGLTIGVLTPWSTIMVPIIVLQQTISFVEQNFLVITAIATLVVIAANIVYFASNGQYRFASNGQYRKKRRRIYYFY